MKYFLSTLFIEVTSLKVLSKFDENSLIFICVKDQINLRHTHYKVLKWIYRLPGFKAYFEMITRNVIKLNCSAMLPFYWFLIR